MAVLTPEGWELLNSLPSYDPAEAFSLNERLRREGHPAERVAAALTQSRLRAEAKAKFGDFAERMLFTHAGLQQSTRLPVAARHAQRFRAAGLDRVVDLGSGLGGDAMAAASLGMAVTAVEADEVTAAAATMNLHPFPEVAVLHETAEEFAARYELLTVGAPAGWGLWLDPARRDPEGTQSATGGSARLWDPESFSPPLSFVTALARTGAPLGVKLGPGIPHELIPADCEAEWVSLDGDLLEVVLWFNALARDGVRRAGSVLRSGTGSEDRQQLTELRGATDFGAGLEADPTGIAGLTGILHEPDPAIIRSGLVAELAEQLGGHMLDEHIAYFCTDDFEPQQSSGLSRGYRIREVLPFSTKTLKRWVSGHAVTSVEIKKRGVDVIPEQLRAQILSKKQAKEHSRGGKNPATIIITRLGEDRVFAVVDPL